MTDAELRYLISQVVGLRRLYNDHIDKAKSMPSSELKMMRFHMEEALSVVDEAQELIVKARDAAEKRWPAEAERIRQECAQDQVEFMRARNAVVGSLDVLSALERK